MLFETDATSKKKVYCDIPGYCWQDTTYTHTSSQMLERFLPTDDFVDTGSPFVSMHRSE